MKKINYDELISELLTNNHINQRVKELNLSREQIIEALPIMMDMKVQQENPEEKKFLTSFYLTPNGAVKRTEVLSPKAQKKQFLKKIVTQKISPITFDEEKTFLKTNSRKEIGKWLVNFFQNLPNIKQGMFLYGNHNVGKTFILKRIARKIAQKNFTVGFVLLPDLVNYVKKTFSNYEEYENVRDLLKTVDYLFIDDIGNETVTHWFRDEFLWLILNYRQENKKTTFFSSNYSLEQLINAESKTQNQKFKDLEKATRLIAKIKNLSIPIELKA